MADSQQDDALRAIAQVSKLLRNGLANSFPVAGDQYITISIPGTVIDTRDIGDKGGSYVWDPKVLGSPFTPLAVRQAEGKLVDGMMPIAQIMIGNTGKSVYRSYSRALDCLIPFQAPGTPGKPSQASPDYLAAMDYLQKKDQHGKCPIDYYVEKQTVWAQAQTDWDSAKEAAMASLELRIPDLGKRQEAMNEWNQTHFRKFKTNVQAKWMDWVVNGCKYRVENAFGTVDIESIMARIEQSKESLRDSMIVDADGVNEVAGVNLMPKQWALECQKKVTEWTKINGHYSLDQVNAELSRLERLEISYQALQAKVDKGEFPTTEKPSEPKPDDGALLKAFEELYTAQGALNAANDADASNTTDARNTVNEKEDALQTAINAWSEKQLSVVKVNRQFPNKTDADAWFQDRLKTVARSIDHMKKLLENKSEGANMLPTIVGAEATKTKEGKFDQEKCATDTAPADAALPNSIFAATGSESGSPSPSPSGGSDSTNSNPWTSVAVSYSAATFAQTKYEKSWGMSVSGGLNYGLFSLGGAYSHEESSKDMYQDMQNCDVTISYEAMVVNIERPWLYGELFNDSELTVADNIKLSPGPKRMQEWLKDVSNSDTRKDTSDFSMFPAYPTAFIIAANTIIEFTGKTSHIETHFSQHSNSGSMSVGYGPFSMNGR